MIQAHASSHRPQEFLQAVKGTRDEGKKIVQHYCASCHDQKPLIEIGAPKIKRNADWKPRMTQGVTNLLKHTEEGFNAMPPRGGCFECDDEQLILAVIAMLPISLGNSLLIELKDHKKNIKIK